MTRLQHALAIVQHFRRLPADQLKRSEILLILAGNNDGNGRYLPMSSYQIAHHTTSCTVNTGLLSQMMEEGLLEESPGQIKGRVFRLATGGQHAVNTILTSKPVITQQAETLASR